MSDEKKPKRIRQKTIKVVVTEEEKLMIESRAKDANLSNSQYLRDLGLGYQPKSLTDIKTIQEIRSLKADLNKVGGLLKNLMSGELTDPKEIRSRVNGLLLDFSRNQNSIDLFISKVRSKIKF
ncbi:LysR family transcriptional regulator [Acinetobacter lwoffii]|jgi:hypothetical protein|uniref:plasmid mobilization protein n=1 Tax=Bacteria TaxID=2 RepID=UPI00209B86B4|nr:MULTISPECIES: LysR family transcriptional regulator [Bacteria]MCO8098322.1 LysR family transcriptional regulator [Acinetobacter lwoffii]MDK8616690.1 hypothetical protein [Lactobacillus jensenii]